MGREHQEGTAVLIQVSKDVCWAAEKVVSGLFIRTVQTKSVVLDFKKKSLKRSLLQVAH